MHINGEQLDKQSKSVTASKPVSIKQVDSVKAILRPKLKIGAPNDKYEQEADRVAEQVMRIPESRLGYLSDGGARENSIASPKGIIRRICTFYREDKELLQAKYNAELNGEVSPEVTPALGATLHSLQGGGRPMPISERHFFEPRFGADFSNVRVHNDTRAANAARSINARAFTLGQNVVFGAGEYAPYTFTGRKLFAHELAHVMQQRGNVTIQRQEREPESANQHERGRQAAVAIQSSINIIQRAISGRYVLGNEFVREDRIYIGTPEQAAHPVTWDENVLGETWEERNIRLGNLTRRLRELHGILVSQPVPLSWYEASGYHIGSSDNDLVWEDATRLYVNYSQEQGSDNIIISANILYLHNPSLRRFDTQARSSSISTGINLVVPDPERNPYDYELLSTTTHPRGIILDVRWVREGNYYFYIYRGQEISLPGDPREVLQSEREDPLIQGILGDLDSSQGTQN